MPIKKLPQHIINKLKAGEIVERPSSVVKELIENSIDAGADEIALEIENGGKNLIKVEDNGYGIGESDIDLILDRYSTSKIQSEDDIYNILTYGFRGEALASISEISNFVMQTKTKDMDTGIQISKYGNNYDKENIPFSKSSGTVTFIKDIFFNVSPRKKSMKSDKTEFNHILDVFIDFALVNFNKRFVLIKDGKTYLNLDKKNDLYERVFNIYKKEREKNVRFIQGGEPNDMEIYGLISDSSLTFSNQSNIKIFVNNRPIYDKIVTKSIIQSYSRQIAPGEYPFALLFINIDTSYVDVNVHPRKKEVKFYDPNSIFNFIKQNIESTLGANKISEGNFSKSYYNKGISQKEKQFYKKISDYNSEYDNDKGLDLSFEQNIYKKSQEYDLNTLSYQGIDFKILGQIWDSFIILEGDDGLYFVDQHALAERINFEQLRKDFHENKLTPEIVMTPIKLEISKNMDVSENIEKLNNIGFDVGLLGESKIVVYAVPKIFIDYKIDIEKVLDKVIYMDNLNIDIIFDEIFAMRACKTAIKAGDRLSGLQMENLIKEGFKYIDKMFACQHGRPSFVKIDKDEVNKLFDRE